MKDGKILWSGEGGFLLTARREVAEHATAFRSHWQPAPAGQAPLSRLATNSRLAAPLAAIALANLRRFSTLVELRRAQTRHLLDALEQAPGLLALPPATARSGTASPRCFTSTCQTPGRSPDTLRSRECRTPPAASGSSPCDTRPMFTRPDRTRAAARPRSSTTRSLWSSPNAIPTTLDRYAAVIAREASAWAA